MPAEPVHPDRRAAAASASYRLKKQESLESLQSLALSTRSVGGPLRALARLADRALRGLWKGAGFDERCTLVAVGGYGHGELFPHSDLDVLVLLPSGADPAHDAPLRQRIEDFTARCWDAGLEIGASVRTVDECLRQAAADITIQTALLEARRIAGNAGLFEEFRRQFTHALDPLDFFVAKRLEMRQRHIKQEDTPYALEPNCKESPGGLRDLQTIRWAMRAAGMGDGWDDLARAGLATAHEARQLRRNEALLARIRMRLHLIAGRREDRLVFDLQGAAARSFGLADRLTPDGRLALRASELLMRRYYWAAKAVVQLNQILLLVIEERLRVAHGEPASRPRPVNERFLDRGGLLEVASDDLYRRKPHAILETFLLLMQSPGIKGLSARTLRALYNARPVMDRRFRADPANRRTFLALLQQPQGITRAFRLMNQTSVLGRMLWPFRRIVGQMQHDLFHVYTVDQHILMVLRNVRRFFIPEHAHEYPFCSQLAAGWDKPWVLYVAALFHDIAKGRGGDHSRLGMLEVRRFCRQFEIGQADGQLIEFLVLDHLAMSQVAQKEDLGDPEVIAAFAQRVGSVRRLTALYLLTVADLRGTSPRVWSAWKGNLLESLYQLTVRALGGRSPDAGALVQARKREALGILDSAGPAPGAEPALWQTLDMGYFMRHDADEIAWHARALHGHAGQTVVRARPSPVGEGLQVLVHAPVRDELFARLCGYLDHADLSILDAKIHTTQDGWALDSFQVNPSWPPESERGLIQRIERELPLAIAGGQPLPAPRLGRASPRMRSFPVPTQVELRPDERSQHWLLTVSANDRAGLLYSIARVLAAHAISVELAKISTLGERVEDVFLLRGAQLQDARTQLVIEQELLQALAGA